MKEGTSTRIIPAEPRHASFLAWVSLAAARSHVPRGFWDFYLEGSEGDRLRYLETLATTAKPHLFHYSTFLVAEVDGQPAAALCGYFDEELGVSAFDAVSGEVDARLRRTPADAAAGLARAAAFFTVAPRHTPRAWIIENVATLPEFRRRGLTGRLLEAVLARGAALGATRCELGMLIGNVPAERAYKAAGFVFGGDKRSDEFEATWGCPGIRLLVRSF